MRLNPYAAFDCLIIGRRLQNPTFRCTAAEIHLFAYLSCLLWLYRQRPVTEWGYGFVSTELGAPFSLDIDTTIKQLSDRGCFAYDQEKVIITDIAYHELDNFSALSLNRDRLECLDAACATTAAFSLGMVSNALGSDPELSRAQALRMSRRLLEESAQGELYKQFAVLRQSLIHRTEDLRLPAVVWLTALYRLRESADPAN